MFMTKKSLLMKQLLLQIAALHEVLSIEDFFCLVHWGNPSPLRFSSVTQHTGKCSNMQAESVLSGTVIAYLSQQKRAKGYQRVTAIRDSSRTGNYVRPVSSDSYLFTTLHFIMWKTCSK